MKRDWMEAHYFQSFLWNKFQELKKKHKKKTTVKNHKKDGQSITI